MEFAPRKLMFKAWNTETRLLMRLNSIDCVRGELVKKDHILLQFTGLVDKQNEEIYEMDVLMIGSHKYVVMWNVDRNGWVIADFPSKTKPQPFNRELSERSSRLWNYFEVQKNE